MKDITSKRFSIIFKILTYVWAVILTITSVVMWFFGNQKDIYNYFNKTEFWEGTWTNDIEYVLPPRRYDKYGFIFDGNTYAVNLIAHDSGEIAGTISSIELCRQSPMTWYFYLESDRPDYLSAGQKRIFNLSYLKDGYHNNIAALKAKIIKNNGGDQIIEFNVIKKTPEFNIPEKFILIKGLPKEQDSIDEINNECSKIYDHFIGKLREMRKNNPASGLNE